MKLILLRHEKRENYPGFFCNLTKEGFEDSFKLINKFKKYKFDFIFCSPLVRTLQTIYPYCIKNKVKVNVEYALYEYKHHPYFLIEHNIYNMKDIDNKYLKNISNKKYKTKYKQNDFDFLILEDEIHLENRLSIFLNSLKNNKKYKNKTILFVSHRGVINKIKNMTGYSNNISSDFPKGHFEEIKI